MNAGRVRALVSKIESALAALKTELGSPRLVHHLARRPANRGQTAG